MDTTVSVVQGRKSCLKIFCLGWPVLAEKKAAYVFFVSLTCHYYGFKAVIGITATPSSRKYP